MQVGVELGLPGFILYIYIFVSILRRLHRVSINELANDESGKKYFTAFALTGSFVAFCVTGFFLSLAFSSVLIFLIALSCSFLSINDNLAGDL